MVSLLDKTPPYSLEAEMAVLGSMLIERNALDRALEILNDKSFYSENHQKIFTAIRELSQGNRVVDTITLAEELRRQQMIADIGGAEYLAQLINSVATAAHVDHYAEIVREKSVLRELIRAATQIVNDCYQESEVPQTLLDQAEGKIYAIGDRETKTGLAPLSDMLHDTIDNLETLHQRKEQVTGVPSGYKKFDEMTAGFQKGNLIIIAARPGVGKTSLALNIAAHVGIEKKMPVAIFSLEMSNQEIIMRFLSSIASVPLQKLRTGYFQKSDWPTITRKAEQLSEAPIYLDSASSPSILTLRAGARRLATQLKAKGTPLKMIIIDYLQLMQGSRRNPESRQTEIAEISRSLKGLARDLDIPVIALSQLNRSSEERGRDGRPQLSDLRESGALEQDADLVAFIFREGMKKAMADNISPEERTEFLRQATLMIAKQRNGPLGDVELVFMGEFARFGNPSHEAETSS